jgi:hypothetical protein
MYIYIHTRHLKAWILKPLRKSKSQFKDSSYKIAPTTTKLQTLNETHGWVFTLASHGGAKFTALQQIFNFHLPSRKENVPSYVNSSLLVARVVGVHSYHQSQKKKKGAREHLIQFNNLNQSNILTRGLQLLTNISCCFHPKTEYMCPDYFSVWRHATFDQIPSSTKRPVSSELFAI